MTTIKSNFNRYAGVPRTLRVASNGGGDVHLFMRRGDTDTSVGIQVSLTELLDALAENFPDWGIKYAVIKQLPELPEPPKSNLAVIKFHEWIPVNKCGQYYTFLNDPTTRYTWERLLEYLNITGPTEYTTFYEGD